MTMGELQVPFIDIIQCARAGRVSRSYVRRSPFECVTTVTLFRKYIKDAGWPGRTDGWAMLADRILEFKDKHRTCPSFASHVKAGNLSTEYKYAVHRAVTSLRLSCEQATAVCMCITRALLGVASHPLNKEARKAEKAKIKADMKHDSKYLVIRSLLQRTMLTAPELQSPNVAVGLTKLKLESQVYRIFPTSPSTRIQVTNLLSQLHMFGHLTMTEHKKRGSIVYYALNLLPCNINRHLLRLPPSIHEAAVAYTTVVHEGLTHVVPVVFEQDASEVLIHSNIHTDSLETATAIVTRAVGEIRTGCPNMSLTLSNLTLSCKVNGMEGISMSLMCDIILTQDGLARLVQVDESHAIAESTKCPRMLVRFPGEDRVVCTVTLHTEAFEVDTITVNLGVPAHDVDSVLKYLAALMAYIKVMCIRYILPLYQEILARSPFFAKWGNLDCLQNPTSCSKFKRLQRAAPDLILAGWARKCQKPMQPTLIGSDEVLRWQRQGRRVIQMEVASGVIYLVCTSDEYPCPTMKPNDVLPNSLEFPRIPCCAKSWRMNDIYTDTAYVPDLEGDPDPPQPVQRRRQSKSRCASQPMSMSRMRHINVLPDIVCSRLDLSMWVPCGSMGIEDSYTLDKGNQGRYVYKKRGNFHTTQSSAVETLLLATNDDLYVNKSYEDVMQRIAEVRLDMSRQPWLEVLLSQELPLLHRHVPGTTRYSGLDSQLRELRELIRDPSFFFDPSKWFRLLEEYFKVNVYELSPSQQKIFTIPNHLNYHVRPCRADRKCVILCPMAKYETQFYNIVVAQGAPNEPSRGLFPSAMSERCHALLVGSRDVCCVRKGKCHTSALANVDYSKRFKRALKFVQLDGAGKLSHLVVQDPRIPGMGTVQVMPVQSPWAPRYTGPSLPVWTEDQVITYLGEGTTIPEGIEFVEDEPRLDSTFVMLTVSPSTSLTPPTSFNDKMMYCQAMTLIIKIAYSKYQEGNRDHSMVEFRDQYMHYQTTGSEYKTRYSCCTWYWVTRRWEQYNRFLGVWQKSVRCW